MNHKIEHELERAAERFVALGLTAEASDWSTYVAGDGRALPFPDKSFDFVYANAVIEHVGKGSDQRQFLHELDRVGRHWIATTPNRWFPLEMHTYVVLQHWTRLGQTKLRGEGTWLLSRKEFMRMLPRGTVRGRVAPTLTAMSDAP